MNAHLVARMAGHLVEDGRRVIDVELKSGHLDGIVQSSLVHAEKIVVSVDIAAGYCTVT